MGYIISNKVLNNSPEIKKQLEINVKDERNMAIANCAKAKAYAIYDRSKYDKVM